MPRIPEEIIQEIKQSTDLVSFIRSRGIKLGKVGKVYQGRCPFHADETASFTVTPSKNLWHCFGCGKGGDVIDLVRYLEGCTFTEAVERLTETNNNRPVKRKNSDIFSSPGCLPARERARLLSLVSDFYHAAFNQQKPGKDYMKKRGITDSALFSRFKVGFCAGNLRESIPQAGEMLSNLKILGVIKENGGEFFRNCVVFPLMDSSGGIVNLYGRRIKDGQVNHLYLPGPKTGIFNGAAIKTAGTIILVESVLDALALIQAGYSGAIPCFGSGGIPEDILNLLKESPGKAVFLCFDADAAGQTAGEKSRDQLDAVGIRSRRIILPAGQDPCSMLQQGSGKSEFRKLIKKTGGKRDIMGSTLEIKPVKIFNEKNVLHIHFPDRRYVFQGISADPSKCHATIKVKGSDGRKWHLDRVDLYSARSRSVFARSVAEVFGVRDAQVASELLSMVETVERYRDRDESVEEEGVGREMSEEERAEALSFLTGRDIFHKILEDFESMGITGEETNKLVGYLAAISRKLEKPLSICFQSRSSAGKSALQDAILDFVPPEDLVRYTRITGQALFYKGKDSLKHKVLAIEEDVGARDAGYSIRTMQSADYISIGVTIRDPRSGKQRTDDNRVEGPASVFSTTTDPEPEQETASRQIFLTIDESSAATARILEAQREMDTLEGVMMRDRSEIIIRRHRNAQRLLVDGLKVVNPYSKQLSYPSQNLLARRDQKKYLGLIKAIAYFRQYQRKIHTYEVPGKPVRRYVNVELEDIRLANELAVEVLGHSLDELSPPSRRLLEIIRDFVLEKSEGLGVEPGEFQFSRRDIREYACWPDYQVKRYIKQLVDLEYLVTVTGRRGKRYVYALRYGDEVSPGKRYLACLVDVDKLVESQEIRGSASRLDRK